MTGYNDIESLNHYIYLAKTEITFLIEKKKDFIKIKNIKHTYNKMDYDYSVQADNFSLVLDIFFFIYENNVESSEEIKLLSNFPHVDRQWHYYTRALHYFGLIENSKRGIILKTKLGEEIFENKNNRLKELAKVVFSHTSFNKCFRGEDWEEEFRKNQEKFSDEVKKRRIQSVISWCKYFKKSGVIE